MTRPFASQWTPYQRPEQWSSPDQVISFKFASKEALNSSKAEWSDEEDQGSADDAELLAAETKVAESMVDDAVNITIIRRHCLGV